MKSARRPEAHGVLRLLPAAPFRRADILDLFAAVSEADPTYLPAVASGEVALTTWFDRKQPDWTRIACLGSQVVGHVSARSHHRGPTGVDLPAGRHWEMCRLAVHPGFRRLGIASRLVHLAEHDFGTALWATCHSDGPSHRLLASRGWDAAGAVSWVDDPTPGACLVFQPTSKGFPRPRRVARAPR